MTLPAPLYGQGLSPRGLFVSRDGALLERGKPGAARNVGSWRFRPKVLETLFRATSAGWNIYLVGNEDSVMRGRTSDEAWAEFEKKLLTYLASQGVRVVRHYAGLDHLDGRGKHKKDSVFWMPSTGAYYHAVQNDGIEAGESWLISDDLDELVGAWRAGIRRACVGASRTLRRNDIEVESELNGVEPAAILTEILKIERFSRI